MKRTNESVWTMKHEKPRAPALIYVAQKGAIDGIHFKNSNIRGFGSLIDSPHADIHNLTIEGGHFEVGDDFIRAAGGSKWSIAAESITLWRDRKAELAEAVAEARKDKTSASLAKVRDILCNFLKPTEIESFLAILSRF